MFILLVTDGNSDDGLAAVLWRDPDWSGQEIQDWILADEVHLDVSTIPEMGLPKGV